MADTKLMVKDFSKIAILLVLLFGLLYALTWTGVMKCNSIPAWCDIYYMINGKPKVLIVSGSEGLGNPEYLKEILQSPEHTLANVTTLNINSVNLGNLRNYALVIVEKARKIPTSKLKNFMEYVDGGGKLIWTGDAGTELGEDDQLLFKDEKEQGMPHEVIGPWARKDGEKIISFDEFISAEYETNYCKVKTCNGTEKSLAGQIVPIAREHPLAKGITSNLAFYVFENEDFAIVKPVSENVSTVVMEVNYGSELYPNKIDANTEKGYGYPKDSEGKTEDSYGSASPLVMVSGFGEKVAYYAMPPEYFANSKLEDKYYGIIENMYYGMTKG